MTKGASMREIAIEHHIRGHKPSAIRLMLANFVSIVTLRRWIKAYKDKGIIVVKKEKLTRIKKAATAKNILKMKRCLKKKMSIKKISKQIRISERTLHRMKNKLGLKAYIKQRTPALTNDQKKNRKRIAMWWRKTNADGMGKYDFMWSDEKLFTVNGGLNKNNDRVYALSREEANELGGLHYEKKFPLSIMVWCGLTKYGMCIYFVKKGDTIDAKYYTRKILKFAKANGKKFFSNDNWVFQQDGASCHTADLSQNWCKRNLKYFIPKDKWPANSPDLNPLDYYFWDAIVTRMKGLDLMNLTRDEFQNEIEKAAKSIELSEIQKSINAFKKRLRNVEKAHGGRVNK